MRRALWIIYGFAAAALFVGPVRFDEIIARVVPPLAGGTSAIGAGPFESLAVYRSTNSGVLPRGVQTRGSWLGSDEFQGTHETQWYRARRNFMVMVSGYPALEPNRLEIEYRRRDGGVAALRYAGPNPGEAWRAWEVALPPDAVEFRVRAVDGSSVAYGWLAFSEPFVDVLLPWRQVWPIFQLMAATCLSLTLLYGPGLLWLWRRARSPRDLAFAIVAGPLVVGVLGLACWLLGGWLPPATVARAGAGVLLLAIGWAAWRTRSAIAFPRHAGTVVAATALLAGLGVAKANLSIGPAGELFRGTVSRTLEVGGHSDSRTSYHIVQLVAAHAGPFSADARSYYSPWSFANRGPLGGLIAAPVVLAMGGTPISDACQQRWQPFDLQGFAVYRITQIVLASLAAWAVFGAVAALAPVAWALCAAVVVLLAPFFVHELYFTWPKLPTAAFVLAAFVAADAGSALIAGFLFALGYLFHPLALLTLPFFGLWLLGRKTPGVGGIRRLGPVLQFSAGVLPIVIAWMSLGRLAPLRTGAQTVFFDFFRLSDGRLMTEAGPWWHARWENFANTFVPLHLFTVDRYHESINSVYAPSDPITQAGFLWWNTLPFALGVPAFTLLVAGIVAVARRAPEVAAVVLFGPTLLLVLYWGAASTGLMRHCGHVLFVSVIVFGVWGLQRHAGPWRREAIRAFLHPGWFAWRGFEVALMAFGSTLWSSRPDWRGPFGWNDGISFGIAAVCLVTSVILLAHAARAIMDELSAPPSPAPSSL